jgi:large subunit ribosomal protein L21
MYAVFEDGSHQYRVSEGQTVRVDYRGGSDGKGLGAGSAVEFPRVLLYRSGDDTRVGQPVVEGMRIVGEVVEHPSEKVMIQHFRRRKNYRRLRGHRQKYTSVRIRHILLPGQAAPAAQQPAAPSETPPAPPTQPTSETAPASTTP